MMELRFLFKIFNFVYMLAVFSVFSWYYAMFFKTSSQSSLLYYLQPELLPKLETAKKNLQSRFQLQRQTIEEFCSSEHPKNVNRGFE